MAKNRYYEKIQAVIGALGDHIASEHRLLTVLAQLRELPEAAVEGQEARVNYILRYASRVMQIPPMPQGVALGQEGTDQDLEGSGEEGGGIL